MMAPGLCQGRVCKRCKAALKTVVSKPTIKSGDNTMWVPPPAPMVVRKVESLLEKALVGIVKEMKVSWKSMEKIVQDALEVLWDMLSQMMALVDLVELVVQGKRYVRTWEMGQLESDREELPTRWSKKGKGKAKEVELEEEVDMTSAE